MRAVAEFVMRGRFQAILVAVVASILPLMQWLSSSVVSLVILRRGLLEGAVVAIWVALPTGAISYLSGNPGPMLALAGSVILASILRLTTSWEFALVACVFIGVASGWIYELLAMDFISIFSESYMKIMQEMDAGAAMELSVANELIIGYLVLGQAYAMVLFLLLGRWWQSLLYNPGGFQSEMHGLRMSPTLSILLVVGLIAVFTVGLAESGTIELGTTELGTTTQLLALPLIVSGLGFCHWFMKLKQKNVNWVPFFYIIFVLFFPVVYPLLTVLALLDSGMNLRKKVMESGTGI